MKALIRDVLVVAGGVGVCALCTYLFLRWLFFGEGEA